MVSSFLIPSNSMGLAIAMGGMGLMGIMKIINPMLPINPMSFDHQLELSCRCSVHSFGRWLR